MAGAVEGDRNRLEPRPAPFQKGDGRANLAGTVKRTGFSARGDKPEKFAESGAGLALSGSHQAHQRHVTRGFSAHSRLWGSTTDCVAERGGFKPPVPRAILWGEFGPSLAHYSAQNKAARLQRYCSPVIRPCTSRLRSPFGPGLTRASCRGRKSGEGFEFKSPRLGRAVRDSTLSL